MEKYIALIHQYSRETYHQMTREANGLLKYPFIVPGSRSYSNSLWDWDSWLTDIAVRQIMEDGQEKDLSFSAYEKGCILNFLEHTREDGRMPISVSPDSMMPDMASSALTNIHKPCLAQHAAFVIRENGEDGEWLRPYLPRLEAFLGYYRRQMYHEATGLYFWLDDLAIGVDNDPCTFYRPPKSSASIYLNCMMYRELLSMSYICGILCQEMPESRSFYEKEAASLKASVLRHLWDERNGFYYSADLNLRPIEPGVWLHSGMPRHWDCLLQKIDCWSGFLAMWAGIATPAQAQRIVEENLLKTELFYGEYGIRTLAKTEPMYRIVKSGNPSCWLGPVWGISNYLCFRGLVKYGFDKEAQDLAERTIRLFGEDLAQNGLLHEYYDPETGKGLNNPGFQNWNLLVNNMIAWMEGGRVIEE